MNTSFPKKRFKIQHLLCFFLLAFSLILYLISDSHIEFKSGQISNEVYVWQRQWDSAVTESLSKTADQLAGFAVLAAEVSFKQEQIEDIVRIPINYEALKATQKPIILVLRIGSFSGNFSKNTEITKLLGQIACSIIEDARQNGIEPEELQIDFDCAEFKLNGYREMVKVLRKETERLQFEVSSDIQKAVPIVITALPCWLKHRTFKALAKETDGFVLQVHSLERPKHPDAPMELCKITSCKKWIEKAARIGVPFRVALPTYGYVVGFDNEGQFLGISAEGPSPTWPQGVLLRVVNSDAPAIAGLVRELQIDRPANMLSLIWYRLPIKTDRLNWNWDTLTIVMKGHTPQQEIKVEIDYPQAGLANLSLTNIGQLDSSLNIDIEIECEQSKIIAADGMNGFIFEYDDKGNVSLKSETANNLSTIRPGQKMLIGWLRFNDKTGIQTYVSKIN